MVQDILNALNLLVNYSYGLKALLGKVGSFLWYYHIIAIVEWAAINLRHRPSPSPSDRDRLVTSFQCYCHTVRENT